MSWQVVVAAVVGAAVGVCVCVGVFIWAFKDMWR